uniref:Uncharacterized protein n=1 Tax=Arundo donax TaxID=35708 RepID=A0A0A9CKU6_ARUDO
MHAICITSRREVAEDDVLDRPSGGGGGTGTGIAVATALPHLRPRRRPPLLLAVVASRLLLPARRPPLGAPPRHVLLRDVHVHPRATTSLSFTNY